MPGRSVQLAPGRFAHASGALWMPGISTALVADAHLGYAWAQRRRGELGPLTDGGVGEKLFGMVADLHPETVVFVGDLVHAPGAEGEEKAEIESVLRSLGAQADLVVVRGNHDRKLASDFGHMVLRIVERWRGPGVIALHGDDLDRAAAKTNHLVVGHWHPAVTIHDDAGAERKLPAFLSAPRVTVLPAFSPFAGGVAYGRDLPPELGRFVAGQRVEVVAVTGRSAVHVRTITYER
jgi:putative SbcD/Mre11-related phosphoesterase